MTPSRLRLLSVAALLLANGLAILAWSQPWFTLDLDGTSLEVPGSTAGGAVVSLALAGLVLVGALAIAGPVFRVLLSVLQSLLGLCIVIQSVVALGDPVRTAQTLIAETTGISGNDSAHDLVTATESSAWPVVALIAGALLIVLGIAVAATTRRWPGTTRRFDRTRLESADGEQSVERDPAQSAVEDWDALSEGDDPTAPPR